MSFRKGWKMGDGVECVKIDELIEMEGRGV